MGRASLRASEGRDRTVRRLVRFTEDDGFRAVAYIEKGKCRLVSRRRHEYKSFHELYASMTNRRGNEAVLDGEIVCLDQYGRSQFKALMFHRAQQFFYAFDLLWLNGRDLRSLPLLRRKARL